MYKFWCINMVKDNFGGEISEDFVGLYSGTFSYLKDNDKAKRA